MGLWTLSFCPWLFQIAPRYFSRRTRHATDCNWYILTSKFQSTSRLIEPKTRPHYRPVDYNSTGTCRWGRKRNCVGSCRASILPRQSSTCRRKRWRRYRSYRANDCPRKTKLAIGRDKYLRTEIATCITRRQSRNGLTFLQTARGWIVNQTVLTWNFLLESNRTICH